MGLMYTAGQGSTALSTTADSVTLKAVSRSVLVREYVMAGIGTASAGNVVILQNCTAGTVATAMVAYNTINTVASTCQYGLAQGTTATATTVKHRFGLNSNGALFRWVAAPGLAVEFQGSTQVGWRSETGTGLASTHVIVEEI